MCILIVKKAGATISDTALESSYYSNPDGWGFSYINTDDLGVKKLLIKKGLTTFSDFLDKFRRAEQNAPSSNFLIHFRISTSGGIIKDNCHPFYLDDTMVFAHNGVISTITKADLIGNENDTRAFGRLYLKPIKDDNPLFFNNTSINLLVEGYLGCSYMKNKIALLTIDNAIHIFGESHGEWVDNIWYSNNTYKSGRKEGKWYNTGVFKGGKDNKKYASYTKDGVYVIDENGVGIWQKAEVTISKDNTWTIPLTRVFRNFKTNTIKEVFENITHYWEDQSGAYYTKEDLDDQILTQYLEGQTTYCMRCNLLLSDTEIISRKGDCYCSYCKRGAYKIIDDICIIPKDEEGNEAVKNFTN